MTPEHHLRLAANNTLVVVLAGGRGSRLRQLTDYRAKPAVPFGGTMRIIDFALANCVNSGLRRIGVLTQYKAQSLIRHVERAWGFLEASLGEFVDVIPAQQQKGDGWYSGTADAVYQNLDLLRAAGPQYVLVLGGDHVYKMDYSAMLAEHTRRGADLSVACIEVPVEEATAFGVMSVDAEQRIQAFEEKPAHPATLADKPGQCLASMGIYVFNAELLIEQLERDAADPASSHDFGKDIIPALVSGAASTRGGERAKVCAHRFADSCVNMVGGKPYWRDVGTLDSYWEANLDLTHVTPELNLYDAAWPQPSRQIQRAPAKFVLDDGHRRGMAVDSLVAGGCIVSGALVKSSLLFYNVRVGEGSVVEESVVLPNVVIGRNVKIRRAIVDKRCVLPDGFECGFDRARDAARFHVTERGITLVTPAMLQPR
jgi:glucose-1-phosphate adenylyltransferase